MAASFWGGGGTDGRFGRNPASNPNWGGTARGKQAPPPQQGPQPVVKPAVYASPDQGMGKMPGMAPGAASPDDDKMMSLMKMLQMLMARRGMGGAFGGMGGLLGGGASSDITSMLAPSGQMVKGGGSLVGQVVSNG